MPETYIEQCQGTHYLTRAHTKLRTINMSVDTGSNAAVVPHQRLATLREHLHVHMVASSIPS